MQFNIKYLLLLRASSTGPVPTPRTTTATKTPRRCGVCTQKDHHIHAGTGPNIRSVLLKER